MGIQSTHDAKPKLCQSNIMMTGHLDITTRRLCGIGFFIRLPLADMRDRAILCSLASYSVEGFVRARGRRENEIRRAVDRYVISLVEHLPEETDCILTAVHKGQCLLTLQLSRHCVLPLQNSTAVQRQKAVSAYFTSKQTLPFAFAERHSSLCAGNTTTAAAARSARSPHTTK